MPTSSPIFYGREGNVSEAVERLVASGSRRVSILGPGGIGKTSVALAVMEERRIIDAYGENRHWVPCAEASTPALLVELLARSLDVQGSGTDRFRDVMSMLRRSTQRRLILLDNFETPWDIEGEQTNVDSILSTLASVPHVAILITMRGTVSPSIQVSWTKTIHLPVLSLEASRQTYLQIHPEAVADPMLDTLLNELGHMPLAVTLMARVGVDNEMPIALLRRWKEEQTDVMHLGEDCGTSVNVSIGLSLKSHLLRLNPDALPLLSVLSLLPGGAKIDSLSTLAPTLPSLAAARLALVRASLAYPTSDGQLLQLLPPIRSYILRHHPPALCMMSLCGCVQYRYALNDNAAWIAASEASCSRDRERIVRTFTSSAAMSFPASRNPET